MEAEFDRAEKRREKERKEADRQRKLREEPAAKARKIVEEAEQKLQALQQQQREKESRRKQREEEEALMSGGISFAEFYKPVPMANLETDKIKLPPRALERLSLKGAIDSGKVLAFELALFDDHKDTVVSKTYCGVSEFTAAEGTVEVPVKAALSLTKSLGEAALTRFRVRVRYVSIDRFDKIRVRVQPLGHGFHLNDVETANLDIKSVLERVLSKQMIISEDDWIPVRHEGQTYVLGVREMWPDSQAVLINTDVEVDLMPSEETEKAIRQKEEMEKARKERAERAKRIADSLPAEPSNGITIRGRFPESITATRRFDYEAPLSIVFDWAESLMGAVDSPAGSDGLEIVQSLLPGQSQVFTKEKAPLTLRTGAGFGRVENLNFRWKMGVKSEVGMDVVATEQTADALERDSAGSGEWTATKAAAESTLDRDLSLTPPDVHASKMEVEATNDDEGGNTSEASNELSSADMFRLLVSKGAEPQSAAKACQKYLAVLKLLKSLDLLEKEGAGLKAIELVDKYKGSSERVADAMMAWGEETVAAPASASTTEMEEEGQQPPQTQWMEQIATLQSMFHAKTHNEIVSALEKHGGSLQHAVFELLS